MHHVFLNYVFTGFSNDNLKKKKAELIRAGSTNVGKNPDSDPKHWYQMKGYGCQQKKETKQKCLGTLG